MEDPRSLWQSKSMQKSPDFDAKLRPFTKNSYGSQKSRFWRKIKTLYKEFLWQSKGMQKKLHILMQIKAIY